MILVGTSGFSYDDWRGNWYPPDLPRARFFDYYAERFAAVEINATFYNIYSPRMMESLVRRAAGRLTFAVKMTDEVTHKSNLTPAVIEAYAASIKPAAEAGVLGAVLLQFPQRFHYTPENRKYTEAIIAAFPALPLVAEIRHRSWQEPDAIQFLRDRRLSLCLTDMPDLPGLPRPLNILTGDIAYLRFHGRNAGQWHHEEAPGGRYDYTYSDEELRERAEPMQTLARHAALALVFFNNHVHGQATSNAETFMSLIGEKLREPGYRDFFTGA